MKKRTIAIALILALLLSMSAYAIEPRDSGTLSLTFDGTTAVCKAVVSASGKKIVATMTLYEGSTRIASWPASGTSRVAITGKAEVEAGVEYRLTVSGTADGVAFSADSVYATCGG